MLFLPAVIVLVVAKQGWLKWIAAGILVLGFIISIETWPYYLIQLAMILGITCTAYGFLDHSLKQDCATMQSH